LLPLVFAALLSLAAPVGAPTAPSGTLERVPPERAWRETADACAAEPLRKTGAIHFFCDCGPGAAPGCVPGDDGNLGSSPSAPKRTGFQAQFATMAAGSTVALCRGGAWSVGAVRMRNPRCRAGATCDLRDYVAPWNRGGEERPKVAGSYVAWFPDDRVHHEGYRFLNLQASTTGGQGAFFFSGDVSDVDICNVLFADADLGVYWAAPEGMRRITVRGSRFERTGTGILGGCSECAVDANFFANTSYAFDDMRQHPVYVSGTASRMRVTNNEIHGNRPGRSTRAGSALLVVHGAHEDLLIENNLVQADGALQGDGAAGTWGISVGHGNYTSTGPSRFRRTVIRGNRLVNVGEYAIDLAQCADCVVESNVVVMPANHAGWSGIVAGASGPRAGIDAPGDDLTTRSIVRNNTIYFRGAPGRGIRILREGTGHVVANNVVFFRGAPGSCLELPLPPDAYALVSHNACNGTWASNARTARLTLTSSPFVAAGEGDLSPAAHGPLVGRGTPAHRPARDLAGRPRPTPPSIGALEP